MGKYRQIISVLKAAASKKLENEISKMDLSSREKVLSYATEKETASLIDELYRPGATIGDGGLADALRYEKQTGKLLSKTGHLTKVKERIRSIEKMLSRNPNHPDRNLLLALKENLEKALEDYYND